MAGRGKSWPILSRTIPKGFWRLCRGLGGEALEEFLRAEHLHKVFSSGAEKFTAVDDVSLSLQHGEKLAIIGESGSGKTTVARIIARLIEPDGGRIILGGKDITKTKGRELRQVYGVMQMVFQNPVESFDPRWTLGDGICEGLLNHGQSPIPII